MDAVLDIFSSHTTLCMIMLFVLSALIRGIVKKDIVQIVIFVIVEVILIFILFNSV